MSNGNGSRAPWNEPLPDDYYDLVGEPPPPSYYDEPPPIYEEGSAVDPNAPSPLQPLGEALKNRRDPEWMVEGLLARGGFYILAGPPKQGTKTTLATYLSICLARGDPFLGLSTTKSKVAMLNLEDGEQTMLNRYFKFGIQPGEDIPIELLVDEDRYLEAIEIVKDKKPDVVIIDPLLEVELLMGVQSENAAIEMGRVLRTLRRLGRKGGMCVLLLHHSGMKSEMRGSSALRGSTDGWLNVKYMKKTSTRRLSWWTRISPEGYVDLVVSHAVDGAISIDVTGAPVFGDDGEGGREGESEKEQAAQAAYQQAYETICRLLQSTEPLDTGNKKSPIAVIDGLSQRNIRNVAGIRNANVKPVLDRLRADGMAEVRGNDRWYWATADEIAAKSSQEATEDIEDTQTNDSTEPDENDSFASTFFD